MFRAHPAGGTGALTFEIARKRVPRQRRRTSASRTACRCSCSPTPACRGSLLGARARRRRSRSGSAPRSAGSSPDERAAAVGLLALPVAFGLHALVDYDLDFLAVAAPTALVSAALLGAGRPGRRGARRGRCVAVGGVLGGAAAIWVLAAPALSTRSVDAAYRQSRRRRLSRLPRPPRGARRA